MTLTPEQQSALLSLLNLEVDDTTNTDEPDPTLWFTGNIKRSKLNLLRAAVGFDPVE